MSELKNIPIDLLIPGEFQPRLEFDPVFIESLAASIREVGMIQPLVARALGRRFEIIAGERRWRAAQRACLQEVPVVVREVDDKTALKIGLIENMERVDLTPIEVAGTYLKLTQMFGLSQREIAEETGQDHSTVSNCLRLLKLETDIQQAIHKNLISAGHGRVLLGIHNTLSRRQLFGRCLAHKWSVEALEREARRALHGKPKRVAKDVNIIALEQEIGEHLAFPVQIRYRGKTSPWKVVISGCNLDTLDGLIDRLRG